MSQPNEYNDAITVIIYNEKESLTLKLSAKSSLAGWKSGQAPYSAVPQIAIHPVRQKPIVYTTTEIRCEEKAKGGLRYEVILAEPTTGVSPRRPSSPPTTRPVSGEDIDKKLKAAEERRLNMEASKHATLAEKMSRMEEAIRKREELNEAFVKQAKDSLEQKMEEMKENREAYLNGLKGKLKEHMDHVEEVRGSLESQTNDLRQQIDERIRSADAKRDDQLRALQERLRTHEDRVKSVRQTNEEKLRHLEEVIASKLQHAVELKGEKEQEMLSRLKQHERRIELARLNKQRLAESGTHSGDTSPTETASSG